jgi:hypothetical protein
VVENVKAGESGRKDSLVVSFGFAEAEVVVPAEIERCRTSGAERVATDALRASVAEAGMEVVTACRLVVGRAGQEGNAYA